jgi:hypothetical protein
MRVRSVFIAAVALFLLVPGPAFAAARNTSNESARQTSCDLPDSNAEGLELLSTYYQGYWWDHTDLTIAVKAHPNAHKAQVEGIHDGIAMWSDVLLDCFDGVITLTDVTGTGNNAHQTADIVVHYVPHFGGVALAGLALCGRQDCNNVLVGSEFPPSLGEEGYTPKYLGWVTMHEVGHALGLGHATNLEESTDLMGYGWPDLGDPVVSDCDLDAIAFVFAWVFEGGGPHPPGAGPYDCSLD